MEEIKSSVKITNDASGDEATPTRYDYSPGYSISLTPLKVLEGASVTYTPLTTGMSTYTELNVDPDSQDEVVWLYNKYKEVWELEKGVGTPFLFTRENTETLIAAIKVYLYFNSLEGSNVVWDDTRQDYVVVPKFVEERRIENNDFIDPALSPHRLPPLETGTLTVYRNDNGYLISDPLDSTSFLVKWDLADSEETWTIYHRYEGLWMRSYPTEDFTYSLENAKRLEIAINTRVYPYTVNRPAGDVSIREYLMEKFGPKHYLLTSGVISQARLDMPESVAMRHGPDTGLAADGETVTGIYDQYSPYASGKNRY